MASSAVASARSRAVTPAPRIGARLSRRGLARSSSFAGAAVQPRDGSRKSRSRGAAGSPDGSPRAALGRTETNRLLTFDPKRCSVFFLGTNPTRAEPHRERRYTLTHNDLTRHLTMSVASDFNGGQTDVWVTRVLRDEVLAEWRDDGLHVHYLVGVDGHWWLEWAKPLRSLVFRQKLPLVLDTLRYAERELLAAKPELEKAPVFVHFHEGEEDVAPRGSCQDNHERLRQAADRGDREHWGPLGDAGRRPGSDQRVSEEGVPGSFSRARDLWSETLGQRPGSRDGGGGEKIVPGARGAGAESVGALIEGALAGGGAAVEGTAPARPDVIVSRSR